MLIEELRKKDKNKYFTSNDSFVPYSTSLIPLDFANGYMAPMGDGRMVPVTGILGGTFTTIIGLSGSGKTTLADQIAWSIISPLRMGL